MTQPDTAAWWRRAWRWLMDFLDASGYVVDGMERGLTDRQIVEEYRRDHA